MKYVNLLIFPITLLIGCHDDQDIEPSVSHSVEIPLVSHSFKIKELNYSVYQNFSSQFIYSPDGRLTKRITKAWYDDPNDYSSSTAEYEYNEDNNISMIRFSPTSYTNLVYDSDGNIIQSDFVDSGILSPSRYSYKDHLLQEIHILRGDFTVAFTYDSEGNLSTKTYYSKGNKTRIETFSEYDDKPNPFKGNQFVFDNGGFDLSNIDYFSNNNPMKREIEWITYRPHTDTFPYMYTYNSNGFWIEGPRYTISYY
jgi:YD repeat-containing protein